MSVEIHCPNGHRLQVHEKFGGRRGHCPRCQAQFVVPKGFDDEDILDVLGPVELPDVSAPQGEPLISPPGVMPGAHARAATQVCPNCEDQVPASVRICPQCHTYLASWS